MKRIFFDTWGWAVIAHKGDDHHNRVFSFYKSFIVNKGIPVTTDYVIAEIINLLRSRIDSEQTAIFIDAILEAVNKDRIILERIDEKRWTKAWDLSKKYNDNPHISFFDFSSFVVMKELRITDVLTADKHFEDVGMGFRKLF
ncbi:type II toxin-antitoxin system VapC family toxin [Dissulfurispira sp.]|uniref:type II toxin-antitoxin system VapC family toxin n=1 Tax=Dissulfurispira sp. TaxID=2817609 RepID=UPI002FD99CAC